MSQRALLINDSAKCEDDEVTDILAFFQKMQAAFDPQNEVGRMSEPIEYLNAQAPADWSVTLAAYELRLPELWKKYRSGDFPSY